MRQSRLFAATLVTLASIPGFLIGQKLRQGDPITALLLLAPALFVVVIAAALMRASDPDLRDDR